MRPSSSDDTGPSPYRPGLKTVLTLAILLGIPAQAWAHSFGQRFTLPMPFELYAGTSAAVLLLTFLVMALSKPQPGGLGMTAQTESFNGRWPVWAYALQTIGVIGLLLAIYSGFAGTQRRPDNFGMTFFWIIWLLAMLYLSGLTGQIYRYFNPFRGLTLCLLWPFQKLGLNTDCRRINLTHSMLHLLAFCSLTALAAYELYGNSRPKDLAWVLTGYTGFCVLMTLLAGQKRYFEHGEILGIYFSWAGRNASSLYNLTGLLPKRIGLEKPADSLWVVAILVGLFAMTALDGIRETEWWLKTVWPAYAQTMATLHGDNTEPLLANPMLMNVQFGQGFRNFEKACLILGPAMLAALLLGTLYWSKRLARNQTDLATLAKLFAPSLIPIILVYSFSHYFTLILTQGIQIVHLVSDPVGQGWNLLGTRGLWRAPYLLEAETVWNIQIASILSGHVLAALVAHRQAFAVFNDRRGANLSQIPILILMIGLTILGLWILSQPVQIGA